MFIITVCLVIYFTIGGVVVIIDFSKDIFKSPGYVRSNPKSGSIFTILFWPWCLFVRWYSRKMIIINQLSKKENPQDVFEFPNNLNGFIEKLSCRKHWRSLDKAILTDIVVNADGNLELLRNFAFVSEQYQLVENNFLPLSKDPDIFGSPLSAFAFTLYRLGSDLCKKSSSIDNLEQKNFMLMTADMAFTSSVLCDPLQLESYAGMAFLYSGIMYNREVALDWCTKYKKAEEKLIHMPDEQLNPIHRSAKRLAREPNLLKETLQEISMYAPHLINGQSLDEDKPMKEVIEELERKLSHSTGLKN